MFVVIQGKVNYSDLRPEKNKAWPNITTPLSSYLFSPLLSQLHAPSLPLSHLFKPKVHPLHHRLRIIPC